MEKSASSSILPLARGVFFSTRRKQVSFNLYRTRFLLKPSTLPTPTHPVYTTEGVCSTLSGVLAIPKTQHWGSNQSTPGGVIKSLQGEQQRVLRGEHLLRRSYLRIACSGCHLLVSQPEWNQGNLKGERHRRGKLVYLIINIKEIKKK